MKNKILPLLTFFLIFGTIFYYREFYLKDKERTEQYQEDDYNNYNDYSNNVDDVEYTSNTCGVCGNSFTGNGFEEQYDGSWKELAAPYQGSICSPECGREHLRKLDNLMRQIEGVNSVNSDGYTIGSDGRVYENNSCGLCKGTGIETGRDFLTGEEEGRICPMCDGRGVRSY